MINYFKVSGDDIAPLVDAIEQAIEGEDTMKVSIACIIVAILAQNPDTSAETIQQTVMAVSELISTAVHSSEHVN